MAYARGDDDELISGINVTPLVDVVLVLLVVTMVTATYVSSRSIPLDPPTVHQASATPVAALEVSIDRAGVVFVDAAPVDDAVLRQRAIDYLARVGAEQARATLSADRVAAHGDVVHVLDVLRDAHIAHFSIRVREVAP